MARIKLPQFPYEKVLRSLYRKKVRYVMIGVGGFNYWVSSAQDAIETMDTDLFIEKSASNFRTILSILAAEDYEVIAIQLPDKVREINLSALEKESRWLAKHGWLILAEHSQHRHHFEFVTSISGYEFNDMAEGAVNFDKAGGAPVRVAQLSKILYSKTIADREKDREFFRRYRVLIDDALASARLRLAHNKKKALRKIKK